MQTEFMREKIKQKPVNKKKLLRRTVITAVMAVVFGLVACFTFLVLEPVISNRLYPEEEPKEVAFPEETPIEEMKPEDMLVTEADAEPQTPDQVDLEMVDEQIQEVLSQVDREFTLEDYQSIYGELRTLADDACRAVVTVAGVTSDVDWFNNIYENVASASGVIVANNEKALLILVSAGNLNGADSIEVTFCDQTQVEAELVQKDEIRDWRFYRCRFLLWAARQWIRLTLQNWAALIPICWECPWWRWGALLVQAVPSAMAL